MKKEKKRVNFVTKLTCLIGGFTIISPLIEVPFTVNAVGDAGDGEITITPSTTNWTNQSVTLTIKGTNISRVLAPDMTLLEGSNFTYTANQNGTYTFIGYNSKNEVKAIMTYVVSNIDKTGKHSSISPNDDNWKKENVKVEINVQNNIQN